MLAALAEALHHAEHHAGALAFPIGGRDKKRRRLEPRELDAIRHPDQDGILLGEGQQQGPVEGDVRRRVAPPVQQQAERKHRVSLLGGGEGGGHAFKRSLSARVRARRVSSRFVLGSTTADATSGAMCR